LSEIKKQERKMTVQRHFSECRKGGDKKGEKRVGKEKGGRQPCFREERQPHENFVEGRRNVSFETAGKSYSTQISSITKKESNIMGGKDKRRKKKSRGERSLRQ